MRLYLQQINVLIGYHIEKDNGNEDEALSPDPKPRPAEGAAIQSTAVRKPGKCGSLLSG